MSEVEKSAIELKVRIYNIVKSDKFAFEYVPRVSWWDGV